MASGCGAATGGSLKLRAVAAVLAATGGSFKPRPSFGQLREGCPGLATTGRSLMRHRICHSRLSHLPVSSACHICLSQALSWLCDTSSVAAAVCRSSVTSVCHRLCRQGGRRLWKLDAFNLTPKPGGQKHDKTTKHKINSLQREIYNLPQTTAALETPRKDPVGACQVMFDHGIFFEDCLGLSCRIGSAPAYGIMLPSEAGVSSFLKTRINNVPFFMDLESGTCDVGFTMFARCTLERFGVQKFASLPGVFGQTCLNFFVCG